MFVVMSHRTRRDRSALFTPPFVRNSSFAYAFPVSNELSSLRSTSPLPNYTQIVGHLLGYSPSYVTNSAIFRQWTYSFIFFEAKSPGKKLWVSFNGLVGRVLFLSLIHI